MNLCEYDVRGAYSTNYSPDFRSTLDVDIDPDTYNKTLCSLSFSKSKKI